MTTLQLLQMEQTLYATIGVVETMNTSVEMIAFQWSMDPQPMERLLKVLNPTMELTILSLRSAVLDKNAVKVLRTSTSIPSLHNVVNKEPRLTTSLQI